MYAIIYLMKIKFLIFSLVSFVFIIFAIGWRVFINWQEDYQLNLPTDSEIIRCSSDASSLARNYTGLDSVNRYDKRDVANLDDSEKVFLHLSGKVRDESSYAIDLYLNYDKDEIRNFHSDFKEYTNKESIDLSDKKPAQIFYLQLEYLIYEVRNENALYVCNIWQDIGYYDYTERDNRKVMNMLSNLSY